MSERLYYVDSYIREFDATVERVTSDSGGQRTIVELDRTAFYPTSGGQPHDTGMLGGAAVADVVELPDGAIGHVLETRAPEAAFHAGETVHGAIAWPRRFVHMQQHSGQHVLSAAVERLFGVATVSVHLGSTSSTIDLVRELTRDEITAAETEANAVVWEDRPVTVRFVAAPEAAALPLRRESRREGTLRLIDIDRFDLSACGGTHVSRTGEIGVIVVTAWERFKGGQRIEFACGSRALSRARAMRDSLGAAIRLLSVQAEDVPDQIARLQADRRHDQRELARLREELRRHRAEELAATAHQSRIGRLVLQVVDVDAGTLKTLAADVSSRPGHVAALVTRARPAVAVLSRATDVTLSARAVLGRVAAAFGGRGGGRDELAQAGGLDGDPQTILEAIAADIDQDAAHQ